jgi:hypothetical protein
MPTTEVLYNRDRLWHVCDLIVAQLYASTNDVAASFIVFFYSNIGTISSALLMLM